MAMKSLNKHFFENNIKMLSDINPKIIEDYKTNRAKTLKPASVNRELDSIKAIFNKAVEWKHIQESPAKPIKTLKKPLKQPRYLSKEEAIRLLDNATGNLKTMFMIALYTGFRFSEVLNLQWQDIDLINNSISVNPKHNFTPKDYEFRAIPLNKELKEYLLSVKDKANPKDYIYPNHPQINTLQVIVKRIFKQSQISNASFHTLRHTFASWLVIGGISLYTVSQLLGHTNIKTTMIYAHLSKEHLKNSVDLLSLKN
jgi:integrase